MESPKIYKICYDGYYSNQKHFYAVDVDGTLEQEFSEELGSLNSSAITSIAESPDVLIDSINALFDPKKTHVYEINYYRENEDKNTNNYISFPENAYVVAKDAEEAIRKLKIFETNENSVCKVFSISSLKKINDKYAQVYV